jgi:hypothetical protein
MAADKSHEDTIPVLYGSIGVPQRHSQGHPLDADDHPGAAGSSQFLQFTEAGVPDVIHADGTREGSFLEEEAEMCRYRLAFEHLPAVAISPDASRSSLGVSIIAET